MNLYELLLAKSLADGEGGGGGEIEFPTDTMVWYVNDVKVETIDEVTYDNISFTDPDGNYCTLEFHEDPETYEAILRFTQDKGGGTIITDEEPKIAICYYSNDSTRKYLAFNAISEFALWYVDQR